MKCPSTRCQRGSTTTPDPGGARRFHPSPLCSLRPSRPLRFSGIRRATAGLARQPRQQADRGSACGSLPASTKTARTASVRDCLKNPASRGGPTICRTRGRELPQHAVGRSAECGLLRQPRQRADAPACPALPASTPTIRIASASERDGEGDKRTRPAKASATGERDGRARQASTSATSEGERDELRGAAAFCAVLRPVPVPVPDSSGHGYGSSRRGTPIAN